MKYMKKIYLKPETNVIEYKLEGVVAMSDPVIREDKKQFLTTVKAILTSRAGTQACGANKIARSHEW